MAQTLPEPEEARGVKVRPRHPHRPSPDLSRAPGNDPLPSGCLLQALPGETAADSGVAPRVIWTVRVTVRGLAWEAGLAIRMPCRSPLPWLWSDLLCDLTSPFLSVSTRGWERGVAGKCWVGREVHLEFFL